MNPVLLKPTSDRKAQVVLMGQVATDMDAVSYHEYKPRLREQILSVYTSLAQEFDVLVLEGAGSPAEINLRDRDIVNMGMAEMAQCPVIWSPISIAAGCLPPSTVRWRCCMNMSVRG